ncbi:MULTISPECIES: TfoX/Sxy family protein [unclassified Clostridium]|uniref:TfoX/Sxy family protein n=1 Tax=unclassified Clostridium TaxID=2614128 RepID=UPI0025BA4E35|nr:MULTISPECIES: TfoX/Sxy family protein [unclassified Clostridium]
MDKLSKLPNIGKNLEQKLIDAGVKNADELKAIGSKEAFIKIKNIDDTSCYNMLCALEGAVKGVRWHDLPQDIKQDLKLFFQSLK